MTSAQVNADHKTVAAYAVTARRMANGIRTDWRGRNGGRIDRQVEVVTAKHGAAHAPGDASLAPPQPPSA